MTPTKLLNYVLSQATEVQSHMREMFILATTMPPNTWVGLCIDSEGKLYKERANDDCRLLFRVRSLDKEKLLLKNRTWEESLNHRVSDSWDYLLSTLKCEVLFEEEDL